MLDTHFLATTSNLLFSTASHVARESGGGNDTVLIRQSKPVCGRRGGMVAV